MAKLKGSPKSGGRQKGTPNKVNATVTEQLAALDCDPIEGMAKIAKAAMEEGEFVLAGTMYKELAQYVAPKRKSIEMSGEMGIDVYADIMIGFRDIPIDTD